MKDLDRMARTEAGLSWGRAATAVKLGRQPCGDALPEGKPARDNVSASPPSLIQERTGRREIQRAQLFLAQSSAQLMAGEGAAHRRQKRPGAAPYLPPPQRTAPGGPSNSSVPVNVRDTVKSKPRSSKWHPAERGPLRLRRRPWPLWRPPSPEICKRAPGPASRHR